ncbi:MAG: hypothetical protein KF764_19460 [Labilithrix sp.]|nr:hypothetical protein [Labilithrix sp.]
MKTKTKLVKWHLSVGAAGLALISAADPRPAVAGPIDREVAAARMQAQQLADLRRDVAQARSADPRSFAMVSNIVALAPEADARARGRKAPIALYLAKLGPGALMPALEMLAFAFPRNVPAAAAPVLRRDLIEAVGLLHDARGLAVLSAILDDPTEDAETTRTVTEAVARIGNDDAASRILAALSSARDERARAILGGMGECRQLRVTEALAGQLRTTTDEATARVAARSLGRAGNSWAWQTMTDRADEARIRETAARALVEAFVRHRGEARDAASNALMVVDAPVTPALIVEARKSAPPETQKALDALAIRLTRNPVRARAVERR